jgi:hypothetical protein
MPRYPSGYYGISTGNTNSSLTNYHNVVTRRLAVKDRVAWGQSARFGGQYMEPELIPNPYNGTIIDAQGAITELLQELNLAQTLIPDLGNTTLLSYVGVATNLLNTYNGIAVSYIGSQTNANISGATGGVNTSIAAGLSFDGVSISTGLRVLYYGLSTAALNGVYTVGFGQTVSGIGTSYYYLTRATDLSNWWQFAKPKAYLATGGTNNKATVFYLNTDAWEYGNSFRIGLGTFAGQVTPSNSGVLSTSSYTNISFSSTATPGLTNVYGGGFLTSLIYPPYSATANINTGEYDFIAQNSMAKFIYFKNRFRRLAYHVFKFRENYTTLAYGTLTANNIIGDQYQTGVITAGGVNTSTNIGYTTLNNLPTTSRYPSSFNRGF